MELVGKYLLSVLSASILCSLITRLVGKQHFNSALIKLICAVFLAITVFSPLMKLEFENLSSPFESVESEGKELVFQAKNAAEQEIKTIISENTQAYIVNKAADYGANVTATVSIAKGDTLIPDSVVIEGAIGPFAKRALKKIVVEQLGIPEENLIWK